MLTVLVNGLPGSGKTTLARSLAAELGLPLFGKDAVKETLADTLAGLRAPGCSDQEWSRILGRAAGETLWTLLREAHGGAVLESPWLSHLRPVVAAGLHRAGATDPQEVWCEVPLDVARRRFTARMTDPHRPRHPVHPERPDGAPGDWDLWARAAEPLALGPVHHVDTTRPVDVPTLAAALRATP